MSLTVLQLLPALESGGVERGTIEIARALTAAGHRALVVSEGGRLVPELEAAGAEHIRIPVGRKSPFTFRHVLTLRRLMRREGVDILHLRSRLPAWVGWHAWRGMAPSARPGLVTTFHGFYSPGRYSSVMARGERVIAVSESIREYILEQYPDTEPERLRVIHRGVDPVRYPRGYRPPHDWLRRWYRQYPQLAESLVLTLPARITRWKGQEDLVAIVRRLRAHGIPAAGVIAGGVHPRRRAFLRELETLIEAAGLQGRVILAGHRNDLREVMAASDVVLSLSHDPEAFGRTTLEALSMGKAVIGYAHGGVREQLAAMYPEGLVPVGDMDAVVRRVIEWGHEPPPVNAPLGFTLEAMQQRTLSVYRELAA